MTIYYVDWSLTTGGEFYVQADSDEQAEMILREVIDREIDRRLLNSREAEVTYGAEDDDNTEPLDGPLYGLARDGVHVTPLFPRHRNPNS